MVKMNEEYYCWILTSSGCCHVGVPSLEVLKIRLDGALNSLFSWVATSPMAGGLEFDDLEGPFQPEPPYDSTLLCWFHSLLGQKSPWDIQRYVYICGSLQFGSVSRIISVQAKARVGCKVQEVMQRLEVGRRGCVDATHLSHSELEGVSLCTELPAPPNPRGAPRASSCSEGFCTP